MSVAPWVEKAVFLAGPTSAGKSRAAVGLAEELGGEVVNCDVFQSYRGLAVLSAQPSAEERRGVAHHLYGTTDPAQPMDAARFASLARPVVEDIIRRGGVPVVTGGSGLYLEALICGFDPLPPVDPAVRRKVAAMPLAEQLRRLEELDPAGLAGCDPRNPRRVGRRLELCLQTGKPASAWLVSGRRRWPSGLRGWLVVREREDLRERIAQAVRQRLAGGAVDEVAALRKVAGETARRCLGFAEICALLDGRTTGEDCAERIIQATRQYARRQLTWFRGRTNFIPWNPATTCKPPTIPARHAAD